MNTEDSKFKRLEHEALLRASQPEQPEQEPLEYWNAVEGWVKIDEVREHFDSVGCGTIYKSTGEGRTPLYTTPPHHTLQERLAELHLYEEINQHYAKCNFGAENLRDWVAERMDAEPVPQGQNTEAEKVVFAAGMSCRPASVQRPWVGLTDEDIFAVLATLQEIYNSPPTMDSRVIFARAIETTIKDKNT